MMYMMGGQIKNILIAIDQLFNTLLRGMPDETISARAYREDRKVLMFFINLLFLDFNHCKDSFASELARSQLPKEYRNE
jgi:hypothetical protein